ncbi:MAG: hypothetical protein JSW14_07220 [Candidatus Bathyarchaeum sp.]|nr:MAG: hypothetical protein JSW14_07220 [Candidatus Bathyarchaeum sp.]
MERDPYAVILNTALNEIKKAYPNIKHSFIFSKNGTIITENPETNEENIKKIVESFETLRDKTKVIGNLQGFQINGKNGKLILSNIKDMYLVLETSEKADKSHIYAITHAIVPTVLKTLETIAPISLQFTPSKKLVVETLSGFFAGDSVQIDAETLMELNAEEIVDRVQVETFDGNSALFTVKRISDMRRRGKNLIRIPEKLCRWLKVKRGDLVKVKPALQRDSYDRQKT